MSFGTSHLNYSLGLDDLRGWPRRGDQEGSESCLGENEVWVSYRGTLHWKVVVSASEQVKQPLTKTVRSHLEMANEKSSPMQYLDYQWTARRCPGFSPFFGETGSKVHASCDGQVRQ